MSKLRPNIPERLVPDTKLWNMGYADHIQRYRFASQYVSGKRVLDAGCGVGYGTAFLHEYGAKHIVGVDISEEALALAQSKYLVDGVEFIADDCESLSAIAGPFDVIVAFEVFEHLRRPESFLARCSDLLDPNGIMVISTPNAAILPKSEEGKPVNPYHMKEYTFVEFRDVLSRFFASQEFYYQYKSASYYLREETSQFLASLQASVRSNVSWRLGNAIRRLIKGSPYPTLNVDVLRYPREHDYRLVQEPLIADTAWAFVAVLTSTNN